MTASLREQFDKVFTQLEEDGFLLLSDSQLPSLSGLVAGEKVRGSWWSHKRAQVIFGVSQMLENHTDVLIMKLISSKVTFVHRELWNRIYSIGVAREDWQLNKLSADARRLLKDLHATGSVQTSGDAARELELRLLIHAEQIHTESGKHAKVIETWDAWTKRVGFRAKATDPVAARRFLEQRLAVINKEHSGRAKLPWPSTLKQS
jgi:hypothetical protein